jgi:hypothetical protein
MQSGPSHMRVIIHILVQTAFHISPSSRNDILPPPPPPSANGAWRGINKRDNIETRTFELKGRQKKYNKLEDK